MGTGGGQGWKFLSGVGLVIESRSIFVKAGFRQHRAEVAEKAVQRRWLKLTQGESLHHNSAKKPDWHTGGQFVEQNPASAEDLGCCD